MNNDYALIPFCTIVSGIASDTEETDIPLVDTAQELISCNYIRVVRGSSVPVATTTANFSAIGGFWFVRPDIAYASGTVDVAETAVDGGPSGAGAYIASVSDTVIEIRLPKHMLCNSISIGNLMNVDSDFAVTYGFIQPVNRLEKIAARNIGK